MKHTLRLTAALMAILLSLCLCGCEVDLTVATEVNGVTTVPTVGTTGIADPWDDEVEPTHAAVTTVTTAGTRIPASDAGEYEDVPYVIRQQAIDLKLTQEVLDRSVLYEGDNARVAAFLKKAMRGEAVTIGVIGGSITQGSSASTSANKYAERFVTWFKETFPNTAVTYVNAGLGATDSLMGVHRVDDHLLKYEPDLVIVEFSVNDPNEATYQKSYEGLVRKILKTDAALIAIQMMNSTGSNAGQQHSPIVRHYSIPTVSYRSALWPTGGEQLYNWSEISPDSIHPNDTGHAVVSELLIHYINTVRAQITSAADPQTVLPAPKTDNPYEYSVLLNATNSTPSDLGGFAATSGTPQFPNGWYTADGGNKTFVLEVEDTKNLSLLYWRQNGASGTATVTIDGESVGSAASDNSASWNSAQTMTLLSDDTAGAHTIEITCTGTFWILGILKA